MNPAIAALVAAIAVMGMVGFMSSLDRNKPTPKFRAGACIQYQTAEPWEDTYRIEMVGRHSYLVRTIPESVYKTSKGWSLEFDQQSQLTEVKCPERK